MDEQKRGIFGFIVVLVLVALIAILVVTQMDDFPGSSKRVPVEERTPAHELAIFIKGEYVSEDDPQVERLEEMLTSLEENTTDSKKVIADLSTETVLDLREDDVEVELIDFLERAVELAEESDQERSYEELISKLKVLLTEKSSEA